MHNHQSTCNTHQPQGESSGSWPAPRVHEDGCRIVFGGDVGQPSTNQTAVACLLGLEICMPQVLCVARRRSGYRQHLFAMYSSAGSSSSRVAHAGCVGSRRYGRVDVLDKSLKASAFFSQTADIISQTRLPSMWPPPSTLALAHHAHP